MISAKVGIFVEVVTQKKTYLGTVMPSRKKQMIILKLKNGYNVGIETRKITAIRKKKTQFKPKEKKLPAPKPEKGLPTLSILHTGGTIASAVDYETGGVTPRFTPEEILELFPELRSLANVRSRLIRNMFSEDMRFQHYNLLAKEVEREIKQGADGIIISHGTDTMHYTSAALAFALEKLPIPVLLVGAQRSSDRGSSDAAMNLICAAEFITKTDFAGVGICMHEHPSD